MYAPYFREVLPFLLGVSPFEPSPSFGRSLGRQLIARLDDNPKPMSTAHSPLEKRAPSGRESQSRLRTLRWCHDPLSVSTLLLLQKCKRYALLLADCVVFRYYHRMENWRLTVRFSNLMLGCPVNRARNKPVFCFT